MNGVRLVTRAAWAASAVVDVALLLWLVRDGWWDRSIPNAATPAAILVYAIVSMLILARIAFAVTWCVTIGANVLDAWGVPLPRPLWVRWVAVACQTLALAAVISTWWLTVSTLVKSAAPASLDFLGLFERLADNATRVRTWISPLPDNQGSAGSALLVLLAMAYLAEKHLLRWLGLRWLVPVVPVALVGWLGWIATTGAQAVRDEAASSEWRVLEGAHTWLEALDRCQAVGDQWTLPTPEALQGYFAAIGPRPPATPRAWTNVSVEHGTRAVAVEAHPRLAGRRDRDADFWRDVSPCELDPRRQDGLDIFRGLRGRVCAAAPDSPSLHPSSRELLVEARGASVIPTRLGAVCRRGPVPASETSRRLADRNVFGSSPEFRRYLRNECEAIAGLRPLVCFVEAGDVPPFEEDAVEARYRFDCEHALAVPACEGYAELMRLRGDLERAERFRTLPCRRGPRATCSEASPPTPTRTTSPRTLAVTKGDPR